MPGNPLGSRAGHARYDVTEIGTGKVPVAQGLDDATALCDVAFGKTDDIEKVNPDVFVQGRETLSQSFICVSTLR
ncbi:MAG: hypothetical protein IPO77_14745 [Acidobacteria bacterium]|nr:hypothetical protein [Acidobacteriota bacterium]